MPSPLALMLAKPTLMSLAQNGTRPQRITSRLRSARPGKGWRIAVSAVRCSGLWSLVRAKKDRAGRASATVTREGGDGSPARGKREPAPRAPQRSGGERVGRGPSASEGDVQHIKGREEDPSPAICRMARLVRILAMASASFDECAGIAALRLQ